MTYATADEPAASKPNHVADTTTDIPPLRSVKPNTTDAATDEPTVSERNNMPDHAADGDGRQLGCRRMRLHYEPPKMGRTGNRGHQRREPRFYASLIACDLYSRVV